MAVVSHLEKITSNTSGACFSSSENITETIKIVKEKKTYYTQITALL